MQTSQQWPHPPLSLRSQKRWTLLLQIWEDMIVINLDQCWSLTHAQQQHSTILPRRIHKKTIHQTLKHLKTLISSWQLNWNWADWTYENGVCLIFVTSDIWLCPMSCNDSFIKFIPLPLIHLHPRHLHPRHSCQIDSNPFMPRPFTPGPFVCDHEVIRSSVHV